MFKNSPTQKSIKAGDCPQALSQVDQLTLLDCNDPVQREALFQTHPIIVRDYIMPTPPLKRVSDIVSRLIVSRGPGCSFAAYPRFGKTYAVQYLASVLPQLFPEHPIISFIGHKHKVPREKTFFAELSDASGLAFTKYRDSLEPRKRLVRAWWVKATDGGKGSLIFLGDEMQRLSEDELTWLIDATNDLANEGIRVISVFFGQPELMAGREVLLLARRVDIIGRFMTRFYSFDGISSLSELKETMNGYDNSEVAEYPAGSGWPYSRFFLPRAYNSGWRLGQEAGKLWHSFEKTVCKHSKHRQCSNLSVGMQWVSLAVEQMLIDSIEFDRPNFRPDWDNAVESTGFSSSLGTTYEPGLSAIEKPDSNGST